MKNIVLIEEVTRSKMLAGVITQQQYKTIIKEAKEGISMVLNEALNKDLKDFGKDLEKFLQGKGLKVNLGQGNTKALYEPIGKNENYAAIQLFEDILYIIVNDSKIHLLEEIVKTYNLEKGRPTKQTGDWNDDPSIKAQSEGEIVIHHMGRMGKAYELKVHRWKDWNGVIKQQQQAPAAAPAAAPTNK